WYRYYASKQQKASEDGDYSHLQAKDFPSVAVLRPLKGIDVNLERNLESSFLQDYANYEIIFSVASKDDPAYDLALKLSKKYPHVKCAIVIGLSDVGINPKVNNLVKGYKNTTADFVWILDSNVRMEPGVLRRAIDIFLKDPKVGLVHHAPCGVELASFGAYLDGAFLNCCHARMYNVINSLAVASCIIGKSNLFRRSDLEAIGGLAQFGKYMAEDNLIGIAIMKLGKTHQLAPDFAYQSMGVVTISSFLQRRIRWLRVRKTAGLAVQLTLIYEPFSEILINGLLAGLAFHHYFGVNVYLFNLFHWAMWFLSDMLVAKACYGRRFGHMWEDFYQFAFSWVVLQLIMVPSFIWGMAGTEIQWRNQRYRLKASGTCEAIPNSKKAV
ncbi:hypothetical protein HDU91_000839, partial [Kappamyces sp. JEL0680]